MGHDVWKTRFTNDFDYNKYLYHYTSIDNAIEIISSNQLVFSKLSNSNDYPEEKVRIAYVDKTNGKNVEHCTKAQEINAFFQKRSKLLNLLCFCIDERLSTQKIEKMVTIHNNRDIDKYFDVSGRGFALPLMWSKYGHEKAVCLIINKTSFEGYLDADTDFCEHRRVKYLDHSSFFDIDSGKLENLYQRISLYKKRSSSLARLIRKIPEYIDFNFFFKHIAWRAENEYRYFAISNSSDEAITVTQLDKYLEGVVCSEHIDSHYEAMLISRLNGICDLKKISFRDKYYRLLEK